LNGGRIVIDRTEGLHIGVDGRELAGQPTGVGRFLGEILRVWSADAAFPHRVTVFSPPPNEPGGTWWEQTQLPRLARRAGVDVFFAPGYTAPLRLHCPSVVAVHDVSYFAHPEWFHWREGLRRRWLTKSSARRASRVVTISEFSSREIQKWLGVRPERIRIVFPGAPSVAGPTGGERQPIVLFVGSLFNRRHIPELIAAIARVPQASLVLVGDNRTTPREDPLALAERAGVRDRVRWQAYARDAELDELYASAQAFAFLSEYEGFAMTPLEALARGTPSVLLDTPVAREIYGDAALYVRADVDEIAAALRALLTDAGERARLLAAGQPLLQKYRWDAAAAHMQTVLEDAARPPAQS
jgi:glycosyltransferase involved in cell wall biosynthesis